jgi:hypothetical protein
VGKRPRRVFINQPATVWIRPKSTYLKAIKARRHALDRIFARYFIGAKATNKVTPDSG